MEDVLKFILASSIDGSLGEDLGLSKEYCKSLLSDSHCDLSSITPGSNQGVPSYPLYKHMALSLHQSIINGEIVKTECRITDVKENISLMTGIKQIISQEQKEAWNEAVIHKGSAMIQILKDVVLELHVEDPFFSQLKDGTKTVEGRCSREYYNKIIPGDTLLFNKCLAIEVQSIHRYSTFSEMLKAQGLSKVLPGVKSIEDGVQIYRKFYTEEEELLNGVLALCIINSKYQPYILLSRILYELGYVGIRCLLGLLSTTGTILEGLPPPRCTLFSSFMLPYTQNVEKSVLTVGARALSKHTHRCSQNWWGSFNGSESEKNKIAEDIITRLINCCCWLNTHFVPSHGPVFEIRSDAGYGARWSDDGATFIGFVEPFMEDGHLKGWKH